MKISPREAMQRAATLASLSPSPDPNPRVGCVITTADGRLLAEGYHRGAGTLHAEALAISRADTDQLDLSGAVAYVTLEPCAHEGRTPSCAKALASAWVSKVVYAQGDPNAEAAGGAAILNEAGIETELNEEFGHLVEGLNADWRFSVTHQRPRVTWKYAATLDGFSAAADGSSQWITGDAARADVHRRRAEHGAILVGTGTALADNPRLTARDTSGVDYPRQPLPVVMGMRDLPEDFHLRTQEGTLFLRTHDPKEALAELHSRGIHSVWLEGGPTLAAAFLRADLIDEVLVYQAPTFLGAGHAAAADFGASTLTAAHGFDLVSVDTLASTDQTDLRVRLIRKGVK